jgi:flagellin
VDSTKDLNANALLGKVLDASVTLQDSAGDAVFSGDLADGQVVAVSSSNVTLARSNTYGTIAAMDSISTPGGTPTPGIYSNVAATGGTGTGAKFNVSISAAGVITNLEVADAGINYSDDDTLTIALASIGTPNANLTFDVDGVNTPSVHYVEVNESATAFQAGESYTIQSLGSSDGATGTAGSDAAFIKAAFTDASGNQLSGTLKIGDTITMATVDQVIGGTTITQNHLDAANALLEGMTFTRATETLTADIEAIQASFNKARVQAGSQYAALESAVDYTTDLTAQYELAFNSVNDVNFSAETAHLSKNQILQQAATAMLAQANSGQQGLLQLIQG